MPEADPKDAGRVAFFLPHLGGGGTEKAVVTLANGLAARGYAVDMILVRWVGQLTLGLSKNVRTIDLKAVDSYLALPALIKYLRKERPRVLISALDLTNLVALIARKLSGSQTLTVIRIENTLSAQRRTWWKKRLEKILLSWMYPQADRIIAVSKAVAVDAARYTGIAPSRINVIYNPALGEEQPRTEQAAHIHPWLADGCPPVILGVGRLTEQKDFSTLLRAFALVHVERDARLIILGEGEQRERLTALADKLKMREDIDMPGFRENASVFMQHSKVFVLSSIYEGLPTVLIEALASGCPVVSTDCPGGAREILADGKYGELVPPGDAEAMARATLKIMDGMRKQVEPEWLAQFRTEHVLEQNIRMLESLSRSH